MPIRVTCPSCGAKRSLSDAFQGKSITCPKCRGRFMALETTSSSTVDLVAAGASFEAQGSGTGDENPPLLQTPRSVSQERSSPVSSVGPQPASEALSTLGALPVGLELPSLFPQNAPRGGRQYRVVTLHDLVGGTAVGPESLEEALNRLSLEGWALRCTCQIPAGLSYSLRQEIVFILER